MSQYNGSTGEEPVGRPDHGARSLEAALEQLVAAARSVTRTPCNPSWVSPKPDVNPVYLAPVPAELVKAVEDTRDGPDGPHVKALTALVRFIHSEVHSAVIGGGREGVSASHLYWAWRDSGYDQFAKQGDVIATLSATRLIDYDPTVTTDQQVVAIGDVCEIEWVDEGTDFA